MVGEYEDMRISNVGYLPIVSAYTARIGLVDEIDRLLHCEMEVSPGRVVLAMILDALTGRSPPFRFGEFFADKDVDLLLGEDIPVSKLNDDTAGRVLDRIAEVGSKVVMGAIAMRVVRSSSLDLSHAHRDSVDRLRREAGCFVLIGNTLSQGTGSVGSRELLKIYKDQHMVERNCGSLKDPVFVNALLLKTPRRIEALGLVPVLALIICRLIERTMRVNLRATESTVAGWEKRQTSRPTYLMLTTKFPGIFVLVSSMGRLLANTLNELQLRYLQLLELTPDIFLCPCGRRHRARRRA